MDGIFVICDTTLFTTAVLDRILAKMRLLSFLNSKHMHA